MTDKERRETKGRSGTGVWVGNLGCVAVFCAAGGFSLWMALGWLGSFVGQTGRTVGHVIAVGLVLCAFIWFSRGVSREIRRHGTLVRADLHDDAVEQITLRTGRVVEMSGDHSAIDPVLCFELPERRLLLLVGQWLWDSRVYGVPRGEEPEETDELMETVPNRHPAPWSFPSEEFVLRRLPTSGEVLSIRVKGKFVEPERNGPLLVASEKRNYLASMILDGSFDDIESALKQVPSD